MKIIAIVLTVVVVAILLYAIFGLFLIGEDIDRE